MEQKSPDELIEFQFHLTKDAALLVVFHGEMDYAVFNLYDPAVADGNAKHVARKIFQYLFRMSNGFLNVDHPLLLVQIAHECIKLSFSCQRQQPCMERKR
jgi:hypothetical protein